MLFLLGPNKVFSVKFIFGWKRNGATCHPQTFEVQYLFATPRALVREWGGGMLGNKCVITCKSDGYIHQSVYSGYHWMAGDLFPLYLISRFSTLSFLRRETTNECLEG